MEVLMHIINYVRANWKEKSPLGSLLVISNIASEEQQVTGQKNVLWKIEVTIHISICFVKSSPEKAEVHLRILRLMVFVSINAWMFRVPFAMKAKERSVKH